MSGALPNASHFPRAVDRRLPRCDRLGQQARTRSAPRGLISGAASGLVLSTAQYGANVISSTLESALKRSRDTARAGSKPIPDEIRDALMPFYPVEAAGRRPLFHWRYISGRRRRLCDPQRQCRRRHADRHGGVQDEEPHHATSRCGRTRSITCSSMRTGASPGFATRYAFNWQDVEDGSERPRAVPSSPGTRNEPGRTSHGECRSLFTACDLNHSPARSTWETTCATRLV